MVAYGLDNWGSLVGAAGLVITIIGAVISYLAFRRAGKARDAAAAAEVASRETRATITRTLTTIDLGRAATVVQRLKELHRLGWWDTCLEYYNLLQGMLADISTWHPAPTGEMRDAIEKAILLIREMERQVDTIRAQGTAPSGFPEFNWQLNDIQGLLRDISISIHSLEEEGN